MHGQLDDFGRFLMTNLRDKALETSDLTLQGHWRAPSLRSLQSELSLMTDEQQNLVRRLVRHVVDSAIHDLLFALQEQSDAGGWPRILVDGVNVAEASDGLHGETFGTDGWRTRFSRFGEAPEEA